METTTIQRLALRQTLIQRGVPQRIVAWGEEECFRGQLKATTITQYASALAQLKELLGLGSFRPQDWDAARGLLGELVTANQITPSMAAKATTALQSFVSYLYRENVRAAQLKAKTNAQQLAAELHAQLTHLNEQEVELRATYQRNRQAQLELAARINALQN